MQNELNVLVVSYLLFLNLLFRVFYKQLFLPAPSVEVMAADCEAWLKANPVGECGFNTQLIDFEGRVTNRSVFPTQVP